MPKKRTVPMRVHKAEKLGRFTYIGGGFGVAKFEPYYRVEYLSKGSWFSDIQRGSLIQSIKFVGSKTPR